MPRPARLNIHRHFDNLARGAEKVPRVACKYCSHTMKKDVSRMAKHLLSCSSYKSWAADNGGEEPDLTLLQNGRESLSHAAVVAAAATAAGGALPGSSPHAGHAQATQGGSQKVFMHSHHQHQHQHHSSPTGHSHLLGGGGRGAGGGGGAGSVSAGVGRERNSEAALLASIQGSLAGNDAAGTAGRDSRSDVTMHHDGRPTLPPPQQQQQQQQQQQHQKQQQQQQQQASTSMQNHGLSSNMFAQPTQPSPSPAGIGGGGGGGAGGAGGTGTTAAAGIAGVGGGSGRAGTLDPVTRKKLDVLYARAIISEGHQFNLYDQKNHPHMYEFLKALNQQYEPPDRNDIANLVMETFFSKEQW